MRKVGFVGKPALCSDHCTCWVSCVADFDLGMLAGSQETLADQGSYEMVNAWRKSPKKCLRGWHLIVIEILPHMCGTHRNKVRSKEVIYGGSDGLMASSVLFWNNAENILKFRMKQGSKLWYPLFLVVSTNDHEVVWVYLNPLLHKWCQLEDEWKRIYKVTVVARGCDDPYWQTLSRIT